MATRLHSVAGGCDAGAREIARDSDDEDELVARARTGDTAAWSRLYAEHFDRVYRRLRYLTGNSDVAEDLAQETFARAFVALARGPAVTHISPWLHGIALNMARQHWRRVKNTEVAHSRLQTRLAMTNDDVVPGIERAAYLRQRAEMLYAVLDLLPGKFREVFILRELEGLRAKEVAELLGISTGNVHVRLNRARARIQSELEARGLLPTVDPTSLATEDTTSKKRGAR